MNLITATKKMIKGKKVYREVWVRFEDSPQGEICRYLFIDDDMFLCCRDVANFSTDKFHTLHVEDILATDWKVLK